MRWLTDENFNNRIVRIVLKRQPDLDILRVQDANLRGHLDEAVMDWAARTGRLLLTHDLRTVPAIAYNRIKLGQPMPGVFAVPKRLPISLAVEEILLVSQCSKVEEWDRLVTYLPL